MCSPHSLQHLLDLTFGLRELLCIAGAQLRRGSLSPHRDHPHFLEIDADRRQIFRDIANVLVLGAAGQILLPITRSAAVTVSLEADELAVGMITSLVPHGTPGRRRQQVKVTHERSGASAVDRIRPQA